MNKLFAGVLWISLAALPGLAQEKSFPPLKLGDPAPALRASKWLQGQAVRKFEPGKVYVVVFWATWCEPCVMAMPCLAELQAKYSDKGVTVIGFSSFYPKARPGDENDTEAIVAAFVRKRGPKLGFTFAHANDLKTYNAWTDGGRSGVPSAFVVDKAGRIAFIGRPHYLGLVVPKVLAGENAQALRDELDKIEKELGAVNTALTGPDAKAGLKALASFQTKYPSLPDDCTFLRERFSALVKAGLVDEATKWAESIVDRATKLEDPDSLFFLSAYLRDKGNMGPAVKAAEAMLRLAGDKDARALINLARTYVEAGDRAKAKEYARKAVAAAAAETAAVRQGIEKQALEVEKTLDRPVHLKPGMIIVLGQDKFEKGVLTPSLAYAWDGKAKNPPLLFKKRSTLCGDITAFAVARNGQQFYLDGMHKKGLIVQADKTGAKEKEFFQHKDYVISPWTTTTTSTSAQPLGPRPTGKSTGCDRPTRTSPPARSCSAMSAVATWSTVSGLDILRLGGTPKARWTRTRST